MDIGKEDAPYVVEPLESPVPGEERELIPDPDPVEVPDEELVPA